MPQTGHEPIVGASAWKGSDFASIDEVSFFLTDRHVAALDAVLRSARSRGLTAETATPDDFDLSAVADDLSALEREVVHGTGIVIMRGFPLDGYTIDDIEIMYRALGCYLGTAESQSSLGDRVGRVEDVSGKDLNQRAYRNSVELMMHTDLTDIIAMLSIRQAPRGGLSTYVGAAAIYNEILAAHPQYLEPLFRGFRYHRFGAEAPGEAAVTEHRIPVLSMMDQHLSARYVPDYVYMAAEELGEPLSQIETEALDCFNELALRPDLRLDVMLEPGDLSIINNYTVLHTRSAFFDGDIESEKRLLLRLWLSTDFQRPVVDSLDMFTKQGIAAQPGRDTYYTGSTDTASHLTSTS